MSSWDWQVFCKDTIDGEIVPRCFGGAGDITYLDWLLSAWGWTLSVSCWRCWWRCCSAR
jgi:glutamate/aspartate transport system permease protein